MIDSGLFAIVCLADVCVDWGVMAMAANETTSHAKVSGMRTNNSAVVVELTPPAFISEIYGGPRALQLVLSLPSQAAGLQLHLSVPALLIPRSYM